MTERPLTIEAAAEYLSMSTRTLGERVRLRQVPHRRPPYARRVLLYPSELAKWLDGCELEIIELDGNGRVVKPVQETTR
jgi:hypothetical protein